MSGDTTAIERLLEVSNKLWDAMSKSGEVPTYGERAHYYLALKDAMDENEKLRKYVTKLEMANLDVTARLTDYIGQHDPNDAFVAEVKAENDKLRKVASIVAYCMQEACDCDMCRVNGGAGKITEPTGCDVLLDLLRELGVVADG